MRVLWLAFGYLARSFAVSYGATIAGVVIPIMIGLPLGIFGIDILAYGGEPYYLYPVTAAMILSIAIQRRNPSGTDYWVWAVPGLLLAFAFLTWKHHPSEFFPRTRYQDAWANLFAGDCGGNECMSPLIYTAPFYAAVAYSLTAVIVRRRRSSAEPAANLRQLT